MDEPTLYRVVTPSFVAGVIVEGERVIEAAPILRRAVGKPLEDLRRWVKERDGTITPVS